jgi:hypothetical protein
VDAFVIACVGICLWIDLRSLGRALMIDRFEGDSIIYRHDQSPASCAGDMKEEELCATHF